MQAVITRGLLSSRFQKESTQATYPLKSKATLIISEKIPLFQRDSGCSRSTLKMDLWQYFQCYEMMYIAY